MSSGNAPAIVGQGAVATGSGSPEAELSLGDHGHLAVEQGVNGGKGSETNGGNFRGPNTPPLKLGRRRVNSKGDRVSMFRLRDLWLVPFLAEVVLMFGAAWLSYCLFQVVKEPGSGFPIASVAVLALTYAALVMYSILHELFLPRKVVFLGVGLLLLLSLGTSVFAQIDALLVGGKSRWMNTTLALTPLHLFVLRCLLVFREARFTPSAASLTIRLQAKAERLEALRRKLRFWLS